MGIHRLLRFHEFRTQVFYGFIHAGTSLSSGRDVRSNTISLIEVIYMLKVDSRVTTAKLLRGESLIIMKMQYLIQRLIDIWELVNSYSRVRKPRSCNGISCYIGPLVTAA